MKYFILLLFVFLFPLKNSNAFSNKTSTANEWKLAKEDEGVKVYTRIYEGAKTKEFKAQMQVHSTLEKLENLIDNINNYTTWQANVTTSKSLLPEGNSEQYIYYTSELPWPVDDRDIVLHSMKLKTEGSLQYELTCAADYLARDDDYLRIEISSGSWDITEMEEGLIEVVYQFYGDPGGNMPNWLINLFVVDGPLETMKNLKIKAE